MAASNSGGSGIDKIQLMLLGDSAVGKSCLLLQFSEGEFSLEFQPTIGIDFKIKTLEINNKTVKVQMWDSAGQERFRAITHNFYRKADGIILVYDKTNSKTFENIKNWFEEITQQAEEGVEIILLANKSDLTSHCQVTKQQGEELAAHYGVSLFETSAKTGENVYEAFYNISCKVHTRILKNLKLNKKKKQDNDHNNQNKPEKPLQINDFDKETTATKQNNSTCCLGGSKKPEKRSYDDTR